VVIGFPSDFWWYTKSNKETEATVLENCIFVDAVRMHERAQRTEAELDLPDLVRNFAVSTMPIDALARLVFPSQSPACDAGSAKK